MDRVSDVVGMFFSATVVAAVWLELNRRRKKLREVYDVLDNETKHITIELERMVESAVLKPY